MTVELNHTIVHARDPYASAAFLARILEVPVGRPWGPFLPVAVDRVTFDYVEDRGEFTRQHYAFLVSDDVFDAAYARLVADGVQIWADPHRQQPGEINHHFGGRGVYIEDPNGHLIELITRPYGPEPYPGA
jgi:catechol 2,3-dioxygenase-like lactoylglutathione lyase family enzyme